MEETLTYDPTVAIVVFVVAMVIFTLFIGIFVVIIRWILRINEIVQVLTDQAASLEDIKKLLELRRIPQ